MGKHVAFFITSFKTGGVERAFVTLGNGFVKEGIKLIYCKRDVGELNTEVAVIGFKSRSLKCSFTNYLNV